MRWGADRSVVRAAQTPEGVGTLHLVCRRGGLRGARARVGPRGAAWLLDAVPALLGDDDDPSGFEPVHDPVADAWRRFPSWRVPRSGLLFDALAPAVIEQKVTGQEAFSGYRTLVRRFGTAGARAPSRGSWRRPPRPAGPRSRRGRGCRRRSTAPGRARSCGRPASRAGSRRRSVSASPEAHRRMRALPGIGVWTAAEVAQRALGDADAVSFGDYHVAKDIGWALTGTPVDDDGLAELLEPYAGHRYRVQHLLGLAGQHRPRRGPRMAPTDAPADAALSVSPTGRHTPAVPGAPAGGALGRGRRPRAGVSRPVGDDDARAREAVGVRPRARRASKVAPSVSPGCCTATKTESWSSVTSGPHVSAP